MANHHRNLSHSTDSTTVADLLERLLDKGVVIAGDIRVKLVEVELLTIEVRLLICSVDRAVEMGVDWWRGNPAFDTSASQQLSQSSKLEERLERLERLEEKIETALARGS